MFCKIELLPIQAIDKEAAEELVWTFLCSLEQNGQILKDYKLTKGENYTLYVTLPKPDSLDERYDGVYVRRDRKLINEIFDISIIPMGENLESREYCSCQSRNALEMQTYNLDIDNVCTCLDCGKPVALYELPYPAKDQEDYYLLLNWQENYSSIDQLWINCLCDRYTGNQRVNVDSALNKSGIEIANYMSKQLGCPVYYHLACDYGRKIKVEKVGDQEIHICPKCGRLMKRKCVLASYEIDTCEICSLSYEAH